MNWDAIGAFGEWAGAIVVAITLIYLTLQIKQTSKATRQQTHSNLLDRRLALYQQIIDDREFIELWSKGCAGEPLDQIDAQRFTSYGISFLTHLQDTYHQYRSGLVDQAIWEAELRLYAPVLTQPGFRNWWEHGKQFLTEEFIEMYENAPSVNLVLYDTRSNSWARPSGGLFGREFQ